MGYDSLAQSLGMSSHYNICNCISFRVQGRKQNSRGAFQVECYLTQELSDLAAGGRAGGVEARRPHWMEPWGVQGQLLECLLFQAPQQAPPLTEMLSGLWNVDSNRIHTGGSTGSCSIRKMAPISVLTLTFCTSVSHWQLTIQDSSWKKVLEMYFLDVWPLQYEKEGR